jgi:cellulose/xylan binding protein with CBM9 domain
MFGPVLTGTFLLGAFVCSANDAAPIPYRLYAAQPVKRAPKIDGKLDDRLWRELPVTSRFTRVLTRGRRAEAQTWCWIGYDARALYVAFRCDEPRMAEAEQFMDGGPKAYNESVEVFIDTNLDRRTYQQYRAAINGASETRLGYAEAMDSVPWKTGVARGPYGWTVEMAIPWKIIGVAPKPGLQLGFNMNRCRGNVRPVAFSCWSNTGGGFHNPGRFGDLVLGSYKAWLKQVAAESVERLGAQAKAMLDQYPKSTGQLRSKTGALAPIAKDAQRYIIVADNEDAALAVLKLIQQDLRRAQAIHDEVRLAVIEGEFR